MVPELGKDLRDCVEGSDSGNGKFSSRLVERLEERVLMHLTYRETKDGKAYCG